MAEGTYGIVFRAEDKKSGDICALKRLKMEKEKLGFPITSLREIVTLLKCKMWQIFDINLNYEFDQKLTGELG